MSEDRIWTEEALARAADALYDAWIRSGHTDDLSEHHIAKLSLDDINGQLTAANARAEAAEAKIDGMARENAHLRVLSHKGGCPYGHGDPVKGCELGYPGCACMDDHLAMMAWSPEDEEKAAVRLGKRLSTLRQQAEGMAGAAGPFVTALLYAEARHSTDPYREREVRSQVRLADFEAIRQSLSAFRASSTGEG